ncbi:MAG: hypothetical protein QOG50_29 [Actinomycetota bacterium]|jgi:hypothetical protein|nr:hypothetical protein [Actinomycetota bacterium]
MHPLAELWTWFADTSCAGYSPLYERISRAVAASPEMIDLISEAPPSGHQPTVLLASVHYLLLDGLDHPLAAVYAGTSDADPGPLFVDVCLGRRGRVLDLLATRHTNTNEVGRSAVLGPALMTVADELGAPLGLVDVGCSAGLNLLCDRYLLDYGPAGTTGPHDAAVRISCEVVGGNPPIASALPAIAARVGIDRDPVDATDDDDVRWQLACVWPDTGRLPRTRLALEAARRTPVQLVRGDALESVTDVVVGLPAGVVPVVMTTWAAAYFSVRERVTFREALAAASRERPVAWISGEGPGVIDLFAHVEAPAAAHGLEPSVLGLVVFRDGGHDDRLLAFVHPHGNWIDWRA